MAAGLLLGVGVYAQSIQEGIRALNSDRLTDATAILQKLGDNPEAQYWMVRVLLQEKKVSDARNLLQKSSAAHPDDAMLIAQKGEMALMDNKVNEAKQFFEQAVTASKAKKADEASILNAVGRAIVATYPVYKNGDLNYAIQQLESAASIIKAQKEKNRDTWKLSDIYTNLGDAYRMAKPGEGSLAFAQYQNAVAANPSCAKANFRMSQIFKSQRNYDLQQEYLNKAITANPTYLPAYYSLYEYKLGTHDYEAAQQIATKIVQNSPGDPNNEYFSAQTYFVNKQYDQAIASAKKVIATAKDHATPLAYKVIAYSLLEKKDTAAAIPYVDDYFKKQDRESLSPKDYTLKAMAYSTTPGKESVVFQTYLDGLKADTVLANKIELLEEGGKYFGSKGQYNLQGDLLSKLLEIKPADKITINDFFNAGYFGYYRAGSYEKAWKVFDAMRNKYPAQNYGYLWAFNSSKIFDSTNAKGVLLNDGEKLIVFSQTDTAKDAKANLYNAAYTLAMYYANTKKDYPSSVKYFQSAYNASDNADVKRQLGDIIKQLGGTVPGSGTSGPTSSVSREATKPKGGK